MCLTPETPEAPIFFKIFAIIVGQPTTQSLTALNKAILAVLLNILYGENIIPNTIAMELSKNALILNVMETGIDQYQNQKLKKLKLELEQLELICISNLAYPFNTSKRIFIKKTKGKMEFKIE